MDFYEGLLTFLKELKNNLEFKCLLNRLFQPQTGSMCKREVGGVTRVNVLLIKCEYSVMSG